MIKLILIGFLCRLINASYFDQKCYICETQSCENPTVNDIKTCSDNEADGKDFVSNALNLTGQSNVYNTLATELNDFNINQIGLNSSTSPQWTSLTRWVCYTSKDKHRGCLLMGKGLCAEDKSWLGKIKDIGKKLTNVLQKAKGAVKKMFPDVIFAKNLNDVQKMNITNWFAENYMSKLVNNTNKIEYQLDYCCEGIQCNGASIKQISSLIFILSIFSFI